eukprot:m.351036 g.351036  ORF g.351036 m.351036 type:complete len:405 (+) comp27972_c0_seq1:3564-4778(+)
MICKCHSVYYPRRWGSEQGSVQLQARSLVLESRWCHRGPVECAPLQPIHAQSRRLGAHTTRMECTTRRGDGAGSSSRVFTREDVGSKCGHSLCVAHFIPLESSLLGSNTNGAKVGRVPQGDGHPCSDALDGCGQIHRQGLPASWLEELGSPNRDRRRLFRGVQNAGGPKGRGLHHAHAKGVVRGWVEIEERSSLQGRQLRRAEEMVQHCTLRHVRRLEQPDHLASVGFIGRLGRGAKDGLDLHLSQERRELDHDFGEEQPILLRSQPNAAHNRPAYALRPTPLKSQRLDVATERWEKRRRVLRPENPELLLICVPQRDCPSCLSSRLRLHPPQEVTPLPAVPRKDSVVQEDDGGDRGRSLVSLFGLGERFQETVCSSSPVPVHRKDHVGVKAGDGVHSRRVGDP